MRDRSLEMKIHVVQIHTIGRPVTQVSSITYSVSGVLCQWRCVRAVTRKFLSQPNSTTKTNDDKEEMERQEEASSEEGFDNSTPNIFKRACFYATCIFQPRDRQSIAIVRGIRERNRQADVHNRSEFRPESGPTISIGSSGRISQWCIFFEFLSTELYRVYEFVRRVLH